jgi:hypothetical protein
MGKPLLVRASSSRILSTAGGIELVFEDNVWKLSGYVLSVYRCDAFYYLPYTRKAYEALTPNPWSDQMLGIGKLVNHAR